MAGTLRSEEMTATGEQSQSPEELCLSAFSHIPTASTPSGPLSRTPQRVGRTGPGTAPRAARRGSGWRRRTPQETSVGGERRAPAVPGKLVPPVGLVQDTKVPAGGAAVPPHLPLRRRWQCSAGAGKAGCGYPRLPAPQSPQSAGEELFLAHAWPRPPALLGGPWASRNPARGVRGRRRASGSAQGSGGAAARVPRQRQRRARPGKRPAKARHRHRRGASENYCNSKYLRLLPYPQPPCPSERGAGGTHGRKARWTADS